MRRFAGGGVAFLVIFLTGTGARAETIDGRVRLGFEGGIIEHQNVTATFTGANFGGASVESDQTRTAVGLGSIPFGPVLGYGLSEHVLLSGHFDVVNRNRSADGQDGTDAFGADLYATLSYVAGHGAVLPFAGPLIGFQTVSGDGDSSSYSEQTYTFGVQAGAHAFATPSFSVDPSLMLGYMTGSGEAGASAVDFSGLVVGIRVALSGWLGGKSEEPRADDEPPEYYPPAYVPGAVPPSYPANPQPTPAYPPQPQPTYPPPGPGYQTPPPNPAAPTPPPNPAAPTPPPNPAAPTPPPTTTAPVQTGQ